MTTTYWVYQPFKSSDITVRAMMPMDEPSTVTFTVSGDINNQEHHAAIAWLNDNHGYDLNGFPVKWLGDQVDHYLTTISAFTLTEAGS